MLLEKAYAKAHGCYENLVSGTVEYALKDLTGGVPEVMKLVSAAGALADLERDTPLFVEASSSHLIVCVVQVG
jgi:hypothetical protein